MHRARVTIDLPSEELPPDPALLKVLRWVFTTSETKPLERITGSGLSWCQRLLQASARGGLCDVIALIADDTELYLDSAGKPEDFVGVLSTVLQRGGLQGGFEQLRVVLAGACDPWHAVADIRLRTQVDRGIPEIDVHWSARSLGLRVTADDSPSAYVGRIRALARDPSQVSALFGPPDTMLDATLQAWSQDMQPATVAVAARRRVVVVPGPVQIARFRRLGFGRALRKRAYRPKAREKRRGEYDEPQVYYFFDPYHDLLSWVLAQEIATGRWAGPAVELVDRHGEAMPTGPDACAGWEVPLDAIQFEDDKITVDDRVPEVDGIDVAEAGDPNTPGFGGSEDG